MEMTEGNIIALMENVLKEYGHTLLEDVRSRLSREVEERVLSDLLTNAEAAGRRAAREEIAGALANEYLIMVEAR